MKKSTFKFLALAMFVFMGTFAMAQTQYAIEFTVDMTNADPFDATTDDVYISGDFAGWTTPGEDVAYKMEPMEAGSMVYTLTVTVDSGMIQYKYFRVIEGAATWDNGEWTGDPNRNYYLAVDKKFEDVWGTKPQAITLNVDMTGADPFDPATDAIYVGGDFASGWVMPGTLSPFMLTSTDDVTYSITLNITTGDHMFKFFRVIDGVPSWDNGEWTGDPNREITVDTIAGSFDFIWAEKPAGIFGQPNEFTYNMYPNPVLTVLNIDNTSDVSQIDVYDATGRMVRTIEVTTAQVTIDVADLQTGVYIVNVTNNKGTQSSKFVKN